MSCTKCSRSVGFVEERKACGKTWHIDCFTCGGLNDDGCKKKLALDGYTDKAGQPYCKSCYGKLFGPQGFRGGSVTHNTFLETDSAGNVIKNDRNVREADNDSFLQQTNVAPRSVAAKSSAFVGGDFTGCARCSRSIGLPEQRLACNKAWHADCFTCGGLAGDGCGKKLTLDGYKDHDADPYCSTCYNKLFGTKGFIGASNMNNFVDELPADRLVNDRNVRAIDTEVLPETGGVKAAMAALKKQLPKA